MKTLFRIILLSSVTVTRVVAQNPPDSLTAKLLDQVIVTGQFEPQSLKKSVYQVRTISSEIIQMRNPTNVQSVLNTELGIRFTSDPTLGTSDITLLGMPGQSVKILLDGVPMLDRGATRESLNQIDVNTIKRIEIVEGPMSVVYGTDAMAGVINIITRKNSDTNDSWRLGARVLEETANTEYNVLTNKGVHNENVNAEWLGKKWNAGATLTRNNFGGWQGTYTGRAKQWLPKDQWLGGGSIGYTKGDFTVWYRLNYLNEVINLLGDENPNTNIASDKDYITNRFTHQAQSDWHIGSKFSLNTVASFQDYTRKTLSTNYNVITQDRRLSTDQASQDKAQFQSSVFRTMGVYKMSSKTSIQTGLEINLNKGFGDRIEGVRKINEYALFVSGEYSPIPAISIRPGVRFVHNSVYDAPPVIPSLNTKFILSDKLDLRFSYGYGFRSPALRELYFYFFDASHSIIGNPNLKAEYSHSFAGSLAWQAYTSTTMRVTSTLGSFYNNYQNRIDLAADPANSAITSYFNVFKYRTAGLTLNNTLVWKSLTAGLGFSYIGVYNQLSEESNVLPALIYTPEVNTTLTYAIAKTGTTISAFYKYTGKLSYYVAVDGDINNVELSKRYPYQWADLTASQKINKYVTLSTGVKNILNVTSVQNTGQSAGAHSPTGPQPMSYGRSYFVGVNFKLEP